jgi:small subunit ribosomal protein S11
MLKDKFFSNNALIGIAYVNASFNNTLITITDKKKTIIVGSGGIVEQLKGSKRGTSYAGQNVAILVGKKAYIKGIRFIHVQIKGFGIARKSVLQGFLISGLHILNIKDCSSIAHNGCRESKKKKI